MFHSHAFDQAVIMLNQLWIIPWNSACTTYKLECGRWELGYTPDMIGKTRLPCQRPVRVSPWTAAAEPWGVGQGQAWGAARERAGVEGRSPGNAEA